MEKANKAKEALFGAIGVLGTNLMLTTEALIESCDAARKGFASGIDGSGKKI